MPQPRGDVKVPGTGLFGWARYWVWAARCAAESFYTHHVSLNETSLCFAFGPAPPKTTIRWWLARKSEIAEWPRRADGVWRIGGAPAMGTMCHSFVLMSRSVRSLWCSAWLGWRGEQMRRKGVFASAAKTTVARSPKHDSL